MRRRFRPYAAAVVAALLLAGCGGSGDDEDSASDDASPSASAGPTAEPKELDGTYKGVFHTVDNPPEDTDEVEGTATMEVDGDTKVTVDITKGLAEGAKYVAHVHNDACAAANPGGDHFKFDPDGGSEPPNEIHIDLESKDDGKATGEAKNDDPANSTARSVVVHLKRAKDAKKDEATPPKVACADLVKDGD